MTERHLVGGHFYPLDVGRALGVQTGEKYARRSAERARRESRSARNAAARRAARSSVPSLEVLRARGP